MMTKRDFNALADMIAFLRDQALKGRLDGEQVTHTLAHMVCDYAETDNPRFDRDRFLAAATIS